MKIEPNSTLLFIGDSITDCGRQRPVGEGEGLGDGYVSIVNGLLAAHHPETKVRVINTGISGNRVTDLEARWREDVVALEPDWLAVMIGINDVWRHFDSPLAVAQVGTASYRETYEALLKPVRPTLKGLILMSPYFIEPNRSDPMRIQMDEYGKVVREFADRYDAFFGDTQHAFDSYLAHNPSQTLSGDRVHPNRKGHSIIASCFLNAIGFEWRAEL